MTLPLILLVALGIFAWAIFSKPAQAETQDGSADSLGQPSQTAGPTAATGATVSGPLSDFANAIAHAEGFYTQGTRPNRNNNPGDLIAGVPPASNYTSNSDGTYAIFDTAQDGWQALEDQLDLIRRGQSHFYNTAMTFTDMSLVYSPSGSSQWAINVARFLGASPSEQIGAYL